MAFQRAAYHLAHGIYSNQKSQVIQIELTLACGQQFAVDVQKTKKQNMSLKIGRKTKRRLKKQNSRGKKKPSQKRKNANILATI